MYTTHCFTLIVTRKHYKQLAERLRRGSGLLERSCQSKSMWLVQSAALSYCSKWRRLTVLLKIKIWIDKQKRKIFRLGNRMIPKEILNVYLQPRHYATSRRFDCRRGHWIFQLTEYFQPHYGPGVHSDSNRNENQESSWGIKSGWRVRLTILPPYVSRLSGRCGSLNLSHRRGRRQ
jgi:hypothetical protein